MLTTLLFKMLVFGFILCNVLILSWLFPVDRDRKKKIKHRKA